MNSSLFIKKSTFPSSAPGAVDIPSAWIVVPSIIRHGKEPLLVPGDVSDEPRKLSGTEKCMGAFLEQVKDQKPK